MKVTTKLIASSIATAAIVSGIGFAYAQDQNTMPPTTTPALQNDSVPPVTTPTTPVDTTTPTTAELEARTDRG